MGNGNSKFRLTFDDLIQIESEKDEKEQVGPVLGTAVKDRENGREQGKSERKIVRCGESVFVTDACIQVFFVFRRWRRQRWP
jgi:hypothetical protein